VGEKSHQAGMYETLDNWRHILITLKIPRKGEWKAQAYDIASYNAISSIAMELDDASA
jgi:hypothetical protein